MTAFNPISPSAALALFAGAGEEASTILANFAAAGLVKSYASSLRVDGDSGEREIRDGRLDREVWDRIIDEERIGDVFALGAVRMAPSTSPRAKPKMAAVGIRFDEKSVLAAARQHGFAPPPAVLPTAKPEPIRAASNADEPDKSKPTSDTPAAAPTPAPPPPKKRVEIPDGALQLDIDETAAVLGIGRTSVYKLIRQGVLAKTKTLNCTRVTVESIRALVRQEHAATAFSD